MPGLYQSSYSTYSKITMTVWIQSQAKVESVVKWKWDGVFSMSFHLPLPTVLPSMLHIHIHPSIINATDSRQTGR